MALLGAPDHWFDPACRRFVLIANDERVTPAAMQGLGLTPSDVLVQFNKAMHLDSFADVACHKMFVFQRNGKGFYWGFDSAGRIGQDVFKQAYASLTVVFTMKIIDLVRPFIDSVPPDCAVLCFSPRRLPLFAVPAGKVPSVGFVSLSYLHHVNYIRELNGMAATEIVTLGFTGSYSRVKVFQGHDFGFEQATIATWPDVTRLDFEGQPFPAGNWAPLKRARARKNSVAA